MSGARPTAINCTNCGAGLDVLGGGRVLAHICGYCGAELDAQADYRVLRKFRNLERPASPFKIGMSGEIRGVPMTIIGTLGRRERYGGQTWAWVEHQLYSPTHGYAWLTWEEGHAVFTRKTRAVPVPFRMSDGLINTSEARPQARHLGKVYRYYGSGTIETTFAEGEFNFVPEIGDRTRYVDLLGDTAMLTMAESGSDDEVETEYELTTLPERDALFHSFGIDPESVPRPRRIHALTPFRRSAVARFARNAAFVAGVVSVIAFGVFSIGNGTVIYRSNLSQPVTAAYAVPFTVTQPDQLVAVEIVTNVDNSWAFFEAEITDQDDAEIALFTREIGYYHGVASDGRWTEGSRSGTAKLHLPPGDYTLELAMEESGLWQRRGVQPTVMRVTVREGVVAAWWMALGAMPPFFIGFFFLFQRWRHRAARWRGSDWTDD